MDRYDIKIPKRTVNGLAIAGRSFIKRYLKRMQNRMSQGKVISYDFAPVVRSVYVHYTPFTQVLLKEFHYLTFRLRRSTMFYPSFRFLMRDTLAAMNTDMNGMGVVMKGWAVTPDEFADQVSVVIISREGQWLLDLLIALDRRCHRYQKHTGKVLNLEDFKSGAPLTSFTDSFEMGLRLAYSRIRQLFRYLNHYEQQGQKDFAGVPLPEDWLPFDEINELYDVMDIETGVLERLFDRIMQPYWRLSFRLKMAWRKLGFRLIDLLTRFQENWRNAKVGYPIATASQTTRLPELPLCHHQDLGNPTALQVMPVPAVANSQGIGGTDGTRITGGTDGAGGSVGNDSSHESDAAFSISALKQWLISCFRG